MKRALKTVSDVVFKVQSGWILIDIMRADNTRIRGYGYADTDTRIRIHGYGYADMDTRIRIRGYGCADTDTRIRICGIRICGYIYMYIYLCIVLYYTILFYAQVGPDDRPAPPGGRLAPRCRRVWGAATLPRWPPKETPVF